MLHVEFWTHLNPATLEAIGEGLVRQNVLILARAERAGLHVPRVYASAASGGVQYRRDPPGRELFRSIARILRPMPSWCRRTDCARCRAGDLCGPLLRWGDCDDLAGAVAAEQRVYRGVHATLHVVPTDSPTTLHAIVRFPDGRVEDPTAIVRRLNP